MLKTLILTSTILMSLVLPTQADESCGHIEDLIQVEEEKIMLFNHWIAIGEEEGDHHEAIFIYLDIKNPDKVSVVHLNGEEFCIKDVN